MNTGQISHALRTNSVTRPCFRGVFAADAVQALEPLPGACVINTEKSGQPGLHWIAIYQEEPGVVETFDSYGKDFSSYGLDLFNSCRVIRQTEQLQALTTTVCGQYCLFFLLRRASGEKYSHIIHLFTQNKASNDVMVCQYVNHYFDLKTKVRDDNFLSQVAKTFMELK